MLTAKQALDFGDFYAKVRFISRKEVDDLITLTRKRNVFARHSWENNFYIERLGQFADKTVIEVYQPGDPDSILDGARLIADVIEWLGILSTTFATSRNDLQRKLSITAHRASVIEFVIGPRFNFLRSAQQAQPVATGLLIDERFAKRFRRFGFLDLAKACVSSHALAGRLRSAISWLLESRLDPVGHSAVVKTAIALESLLIATDTESLTRSLSERAAFMLGKEFNERKDVARAVRRFYDMRSMIVHGGKKRPGNTYLKMLEGADRLVILICLTMAANIDTIGTVDNLASWCEDKRWGGSQQGLRLPFKPSVLSRALRHFADLEVKAS